LQEAIQAGPMNRKQLEAEIAAFCKSHEMSGWRFGQLALGDGSFWCKFIRGRNPTLATVERLRTFMNEYRQKDTQSC
jgi:hypothetical protein